MKQTIKKLITMVITLVAVSFCVFLAFSLISGDAATTMLGTQATPERVEALRQELGLNDPLLIRYGKWLGAFLTGDMGTSYSYGSAVTELIADKIPITLTLTLLSFLMIVVLSVPIGIYSAKHAGSVIDRAISVINQIMMAIPPFFSGILITFVFGLIFKLFTPGGFVSYTKSFSGFIGYMIFPAIAIAIPKAAMAAKLLRSSVLEEAEKDYVRTAYSRGNKTSGVLYAHVLKNALIPVITFWGMTLADIVAGSIIVEQVFGIPGIGRILLTSISHRDYPVVQEIIVCLAFLILLINFIVDIIYRKIDPRMAAE